MLYSPNQRCQNAWCPPSGDTAAIFSRCVGYECSLSHMRNAGMFWSRRHILCDQSCMCHNKCHAHCSMIQNRGAHQHLPSKINKPKTFSTNQQIFISTSYMCCISKIVCLLNGSLQVWEKTSMHLTSVLYFNCLHEVLHLDLFEMQKRKSVQ